MDYQYFCYTADKKLAKGTVAAVNPEKATELLARQGYQVLGLKPVATFIPVFNWEEMFPSLFQVKPQAVIMFSRQLALLLESGTDIVTSLELLHAQITNRRFRRVLGEAISDLRAGNRLSVALGKHQDIFPAIYCRSLSVGEQTGGLEITLRQIADYMEKETTTKRGIKSALMYPIMVSIVAVVVVAVLVTFVLPSFMGLYSSMGAELPLLTRLLLAIVDGLNNYGHYLMVALVIIGLVTAIYIRTPEGSFRWNRLALTMPLLGQVNHFTELARCCRSMALLFRSGLPLTEIMNMVIAGSSNKAMVAALSGVQQDMLKGEGLSQPMAKNPLFLPMMVQMVRVGEETGNLDTTLLAVAQAYEAEAEDKTRALIGFIQPALTLGIGLVVAFITLALLSAMYSIYGQMG
ncbi:type II secretion system F family protein [Chloroflexota bacterium]